MVFALKSVEYGDIADQLKVHASEELAHTPRWQERSILREREVFLSYEGTDQMQNLILGKAITGLSAFV